MNNFYAFGMISFCQKNGKHKLVIQKTLLHEKSSLFNIGDIDISSTFYEQLLHMQIPKGKKKILMT